MSYDAAWEHFEETLRQGELSYVSDMMQRYRGDCPQGVFEGKVVKTYFHKWAADRVAELQGITGR